MIPKKYHAGLKGARRRATASLIKQVSALYRAGLRIPRNLLKRRTRA